MGSYWYGPDQTKLLSKIEIQVLCLKVKAHLGIHKQKKIEDLQKDQRDLLQMFKAKQRNQIVEVIQAQKVISDLRLIQVCATLSSYAQNLKFNAEQISKNNKVNQMNDLELNMYVDSLIFASSKLNLSSLKQFRKIMSQYWGIQIQGYTGKVDPQLIQSFKIKSSKQELNQYFIEMSQRNNISIDKINEGGHNVIEQRSQKFNYPFPTQQDIKIFLQDQQKLKQEYEAAQNMSLAEDKTKVIA